MPKNLPLVYNGKSLLIEREKQKLSISDIATQLTLSDAQIQSIEKNLENGFASDHFRKLSVQRYAKLLSLPIGIVIPEIPENEDEDEDEDNDEDLLAKLNNKKSTINYLIIAVIAIALLFLFLIINSIQSSKIIEDNLTISLDDDSVISMTSEDSEASSDESPIVLIEDDIASNEIDTKINLVNTPLSSVNSQEMLIEFLCTIENANDLTNFTTRSPEKPSTYFHLISSEAQTFCTIDSNGALRTYDLEKGEKLTHKGTAPFKIQLDPTITELYFEGWKVQLQNDDSFIQLNPGLIVEQD